MKNSVLLFAMFLFCITIIQPVHAIVGKESFAQVPRQCIKIWCLMRNMVDNNYAKDKDTAIESDSVDLLDNLLCRIMRVREIISHMDTTAIYDLKDAQYIDNSLDCIESYSYDLVQRYPGSWSTIIQEQVFRTQDAYARCVLPLLTK